MSTYYEQTIRDHGANAETLQMICAEVEDARRIVRNLEEEAKMNREIAAKDIAALRDENARLKADFAGCSKGKSRDAKLVTLAHYGDILTALCAELNVMRPFDTVEAVKTLRTQLASLTAEAEKLRGDGEWRSMDDPALWDIKKNQERVLLRVPFNQFENPEVQFSVTVGYWNKASNYDEGYWQNPDWSRFNVPTHWKPLPSAAIDAAQQADAATGKTEGGKS